MTRTILYYPTIAIPNPRWLRHALFYFDKVASIVPQVLFNRDTRKWHVPALTPELEYLHKEGVYEPIDPEGLSGDMQAPIVTADGQPNQKRKPERPATWEVAHRLKDEFTAKIKEEKFKAGPKSKFVRVHRGKLHGTLLPFLEKKKLLKYDVAKDRYKKEWFRAEWFLVEERTALVYMGMLAQALADLYPESMVPGTDQLEYESLIYGAPPQGKSFRCIETLLRAVLPVPRQNVPLKKILAFKQKRHSELLRYREKIDKLHRQLKQATEPGEAKEVLTQFGEELPRSLRDLIGALNDAKLATIWGSVKTLTSVTVPTSLAAAAVVGGVAPAIAALPIGLVIGALVIKGAIDVISYRLDERNKQRALERASPFAYLHYAKKKGIL